MSGQIDTVCLDADDTLWQNLTFYRFTEARFQEILADYADPSHLGDRLLQAERRNLKIYGFGIKGFTLSMIETAVEATDGRAPAQLIAEILKAGREMLSHPVEFLPGVEEALDELGKNHKLVLVTKGDLFDQERKIAMSGLADRFAGVEIVSDKNVETYRRIFARYADSPSRVVMAGNSLKSDVTPAIEAGGAGVFVPHQIEWAIEYAEEPTDHRRYRRIVILRELTAAISSLDAKD